MFQGPLIFVLVGIRNTNTVGLRLLTTEKETRLNSEKRVNCDEAKNPKSWTGSLLIRVGVTQSTELGARREGLLLQHYLSKESYGNKI